MLFFLQVNIFCYILFVDKGYDFMNKKGFTLIELLCVIVLIGLILGIATTGVIRAGKKAKEKTLATKVKNIEKAAIVYGQDHRENFVDVADTDGDDKPLCFETKSDGTKSLIPNCKYYNNVITVNDLLNNDDDNEPYINADTDEGKILNPTDDNKSMNDCKIQIYQKYGKIYAVYLSKNNAENGTTKCWK